MKEYEVWCEGFIATGQRGYAYLMGRANGETFEKACITLMHSVDPHWNYYNKEKNTYWGCTLYDNETDARKFAG